MKLPRLLQASDSQGVKAENQALAYLQEQGLSLICRNYYCPFGEIDLIMQEQNILVFIEVRYRKQESFGNAFASITRRKQHKIIKTAKHYLRQLGRESYCRFDAIAIDQTETVQWLKGAFTE